MITIGTKNRNHSHIYYDKLLVLPKKLKLLSNSEFNRLINILTDYDKSKLDTKRSSMCMIVRNRDHGDFIFT
jgi:hypothetical protein